MSRLLVGPFNRVEGDLEVQLDIADGQVNFTELESQLLLDTIEEEVVPLYYTRGEHGCPNEWVRRCKRAKALARGRWSFWP